MLKKRFFLGSLITFLLMLSLSMLYAQATVEILQDNTPTPTPTPRPQKLRKSVLASAMRGLQLNAPNDDFPPPCQNAQPGVSIWQNDTQYTSGSTIQLPLFREAGFMLRTTEAYLPAICSSEQMHGGVATNLSTGQTLSPHFWSYETFGDAVPRFWVAQLILDAYEQPGTWRLHVDSPTPTDVDIQIDRPQRPVGLLEPRGRYLVMGFHPGEGVVGLIYNDVGDAHGNITGVIQDSFEVSVDGNGIGEVKEQPYWDDVTGPNGATTGLMVLVGNQGSSVYYPQGQNGLSIFTGDGSIHAADHNQDGSITIDELISYVRQNYWTRETSNPPPSNSGSSGGSSNSGNSGSSSNSGGSSSSSGSQIVLFYNEASLYLYNQSGASIRANQIA